MSRSIVVRLAIAIAAILIVAFVVLLAIFLNFTSLEFAEAQIEKQTHSPIDQQSFLDLSGKIEDAYETDGWPGVQLLVDNLINSDRQRSYDAFVINQQLAVVATSTPELEDINAKIEDDETLLLSGNQVAGVLLELAVDLRSAIPIRDGDEIVGRLFVSPLIHDEPTGPRFAQEVWKSAAIWLILTIALAVTVTTFALRHSLRPISELTHAARVLQSGKIPERIEIETNSEFEQLIEAFNSASKTIAQTDKIRKQLISDVAHELRTPLTNIRGQLEAGRSGLIPTDADWLMTLTSETQLLERLVADFQQLAVSDSGCLKVHLQNTPLRELVQNILAPFLAHEVIDLTLTIPDDVFVQLDEERMKQVLGNLMENSIRNQPHGLEVFVDAQIDEPYVRMTFADNGSGVDREHREFIFDRLYRVEKSRNRDSGGSGLGLAIVKAIVEAMRGTIKYVDDPRFGAKFELSLLLTSDH